MALCGGAMVTVGSTVVASRLIASGLPPFTATALRFAVAAPVLWCLMRLTGTAWPRPDRRDGALLLAQAVAGSVRYTVLLILGTRHAPAADAGVVAGTLPAVAALFAVLALGERPTRALLLSTALATLGVLAISLPEARSAVRGAGSGALLGHALVLGAVVCEATFILINKRLRVPVPPLALSATMSVLGLLTCAVPALLEQPWLRAVPATQSYLCERMALGYGAADRESTSPGAPKRPAPSPLSRLRAASRPRGWPARRRARCPRGRRGRAPSANG